MLVACDVSRYHSDSLTTILASITPSSSQNPNLSQQAAPGQHNFTATISPNLSLESNISAYGKPHPSAYYLAPSTGERPAGESTHLRFFRLLSGFGRELTALHCEGQRLPSDHPLHKLWMLAREPQPTLFETRPVQRDKSFPSTKTNLPLDCMVLRGGDWVRELQPDSRFTGALIRDEYAEALRAIMKWFLPVTEDVDDVEPAPLKNPFLDVPTGLVSKKWGFVLLGDPGIGERSCFLSHHSDDIYQCRENCALICFTGSAPPSAASDHLSVTRQPSILFRRRWRLPDQFDFEYYRHKLQVSVSQINMVFD